jgi:sterol desaturase/sphingolipid hydroxylase (fatty acid hydroxylase superfamily)
MRGMSHITACVAASIVVAELLGYLLHRLMHSGWIPWLSTSHMKHHMVLYGPLQKQRPSEQYLDATTGQVALGNIGLEWIIPSSVILAISVAALRLLRVSLTNQAVSIGTILAWSFLMFSYLHDRMHIKNFWMERAPFLRLWFVRARRLHDLHHHALNNSGLMDKNFGIGFFAFDRLFGTLAFESSGFNHLGYAAAQVRFRNLLCERGGSAHLARVGNPTTKARRNTSAAVADRSPAADTFRVSTLR